MSRSIESLARSVAGGGDEGLVVSLFQERAYLSASLSVYRGLQGHLSLLVGCVGAEPVEGIPAVDLPVEHPLAEEWVVLLVSPRRCAGLVARDLRRVGVGATLEASRLFEAWTSTDPAAVAGQVRRLVESAAEYMRDDDVRRLLAGAASAGTRAVDGDPDGHALPASWAAIVRRSRARPRAEREVFTDPVTGALNATYLEMYLGALGPRSPQLAMAAVVVGGVGGDGPGSETLLRDVVASARRSTGPGDVLVRRGDALLVVMPGSSADAARAVAGRVVDEQAPVGASRLATAVDVFAPDGVDVGRLVEDARSALDGGRGGGATVASGGAATDGLGSSAGAVDGR